MRSKTNKKLDKQVCKKIFKMSNVFPYSSTHYAWDILTQLKYKSCIVNQNENGVSVSLQLENTGYYSASAKTVYEALCIAALEAVDAKS